MRIAPGIALFCLLLCCGRTVGAQSGSSAALAHLHAAIDMLLRRAPASAEEQGACAEQPRAQALLELDLKRPAPEGSSQAGAGS